MGGLSVWGRALVYIGRVVCMWGFGVGGSMHGAALCVRGMLQVYWGTVCMGGWGTLLWM